MRGYILAHGAALLGCVAMVAYLDRPRIAPLSGYAAAALVALYAHTTMAMFVALANLAMLGLLRRDRNALLLLLALAWLVGCAWFAVRDRRPAVVLLSMLAIGAPLLLWALSQKPPIFLPRALFWAARPMMELVCVALAPLPSVPVHVALVGLLLALEVGAVPALAADA